MILHKKNCKLKKVAGAKQDPIHSLLNLSSSKINKAVLFNVSSRTVSCFHAWTSTLFVENPNVFGVKKSQKNSRTFASIKTVKKPVDRVLKREKKRQSLILPRHIGRVFLVHNGKTFSSIHISRKMLGHKFGEFSSTRKKPLHKKKKK